jgi:mono/diheme cytochrome c family protein
MRILRIEWLLLSLIAATSCSKKAEREWSASDHDRLDDPPAQGPGPAQPSNPAASSPAPQNADANAVWQSSCTPCHGATGKGDGPAGRALRVPDLTSLQSRLTDEQITGAIKKGKGQMPAFNFPPEVSGALVKKIRTLR